MGKQAINLLLELVEAAQQSAESEGKSDSTEFSMGMECSQGSMP